MKILLLGSKGYLGSYLSSRLQELDLVDRLDLSSERFIKFQDKLFFEPKVNCNYDYAINCCGLVNLKECNEELCASETANLEPTRWILKNCPGAKIINFSSYYIYNDENLCSETSQTEHPYESTSTYIRHKLKTEFLLNRKNHVNFRLGKLFGHPSREDGRLTSKIYKCIFQGEPKEMILDKTLFNPCSVQQVLEVVEAELKHGDMYGTYNLANDELMTHYEYGCLIEKLGSPLGGVVKIKCGPPPKGTRELLPNYGRFAMDTSKLSGYLKGKGKFLRNVEDDLRLYFENKTN